jgi:hypothetical protein
MWDIMSKAQASKFDLTAATQEAYLGLAAGHAYTILGMYEIKDA